MQEELRGTKELLEESLQHVSRSIAATQPGHLIFYTLTRLETRQPISNQLHNSSA
jgi:hypothetical protein